MKGLKSLGCLGVLVILIASVILSGFVLQLLWSWFVVPTFDAPSLTIPAAIGLSCVVTYLTNEGNTANQQKENMDEAVIRLLTFAIGRPVMYLGIGWVIHLFF